MRQPLLDITQNFIEREALFTTNDRLLLAISGGIDSVCLAYVLRELDYDFDLIHVNFKLRGTESDGDQAFVERLAGRLKVKLRLQSSNAEAIKAMSDQSLQATARDLRYKFFQTVAETDGYDYVLTAHHLEDNLETTLMNLLRGTGTKGLTGIPAKRGIYCRPFLEAPRQDIEHYAAANHLLWREDTSNASDNYRRNHLRHHVLPGLKSLDQDWSHQLIRTYQNLRHDQELIHYSLTKTFEDTLNTDGNIIRGKLPADPKIAEQLLKHSLTKYGFTGDQFRQMVVARPGSEIIAKSAGKLVKIQADLLVIRDNKNTAQKTSGPGTGEKKTLLITATTATLKFPKNQTLNLAEIARPEKLDTNDPTTIYLSKIAAPLPWHLRRPEPGDHFQPFGMNGQSKKLQDYFTDIKLPRAERAKQRLLCDSEDNILWILGLRMSEIGRIRESEETVYRIQLT